MNLLALSLACSDYAVKRDTSHPGSAGSVGPDIAVDPEALAFDPLAPGSSADQTLTVENHGDADLSLQNVSLLGTTAFTLTNADVPATLAPGDIATWTVTFSPINPEDEGSIVIDSDDPDTPSLSVPVSGGALAPELMFDPNPYDFGPVLIGCSATAPVTLHNGGQAPLVIDAIAEDGDRFALDVPFDLPLTLAPEEDATVNLTFTPTQEPEAEGVLYVTSNDLVPTRTHAQWGTGTSISHVDDTFYQGDGPWDRTDILLYVDQSCSMEDDQRNLASNFGDFVDALSSAALDWQLIVATGDSGCANEHVFSPENVDEGDFLRAVRGGGGRWTEAGLTVARNALEEAGDGCNAGFLREDSKTTIILVSDEPEQSRDRPEDLVADIVALAPTAAIHAIAGDLPYGCRTAEAGHGYDTAATLTGGVFLSICDSDWGSYFDEISETASRGTTGTFPLSARPNPATIVVTVDRATVTGWSYAADSNAIVFDDDAWPAPRSSIVVSYEIASDCEG